MEKEQIVKELTTIFRDVLDNDSIALTNTTTANDIDEWDSLSHIQLIVAMEKHFKIKFTSAEIREWKNIGELANSIAAKL